MATRQDHTPQTSAPRRRSGSSRPVPPPQQRTIQLGGRQITYTLRVSARARNLCLRVKPTTGLEVVAPRGVSVARGEEVLRQKAHWVLTTLDRMAREEAARKLPPLADGQELPYAGERIRLAISTGAPAGRFRAILHGDTLALTVSDGEQETIRRALEAWYRRQALEVFAARLAICNRAYGFSYGQVSIKEQKSRWGSCSRQGNLNFNWRLLLAPLPVLDYVVTHELAHLKEMNHSPRFWSLVASACPNYKISRKWLRDFGRDLRF